MAMIEQLAAQTVGAARAVVKAFDLQAEFCQVYDMSAAIYSVDSTV